MPFAALASYCHWLAVSSCCASSAQAYQRDRPVPRCSMPFSTSAMTFMYTFVLVALINLSNAQQSPSITSSASLTNGNTCGYTSGLASYPVTCSWPLTCTYYSDAFSYTNPNFGCCTSACYVSTCLDYGASGNPWQGGNPAIESNQFYWYADVVICREKRNMR